MAWNWQLRDWPRFTYDRARLAEHEAHFREQFGLHVGVSRHLSGAERDDLRVSILAEDALDTSRIEGEVLDRESVQSSIQRALGLKAPERASSPAERGIAELMVDLFRSGETPLSHDLLFRWHSLVVAGRRDIVRIGAYRADQRPMQIVSGVPYAPIVHFEAPPSSQVPGEMDTFIAWFNGAGPGGPSPLGAIERAGLAHLWFECIHPFEDGNGRIGRAVSELALIQGRREAVLTGLASVMLARRKDYYGELEAASRMLGADRWLAWFAKTALEAQGKTLARVTFVLAKTKLMTGLQGRLNARQEKVLLRMFREGPDGFKGGLSAKNYMTITGAPPATTTRDLGDLVDKGALTRRGERKATRYYLNLAE